MDVKTVVIGILIGLIIFIAGFGGFLIIYPTFTANNQAVTATNSESSENTDKKKVLNDNNAGEDKISNKNSKKSGISEKERKERIAALTSGMKINKDDMKNVTEYSYPEDYDTQGIKLMPLIVKNNETNNTQMALGALYKGDDWIFFDKIYFKADEERFQINTPHLNATSDVIMGVGVIELHEILVDDKIEDYVEKISKAKNVRMRFAGKYSDERDMTPTEIERIRNMKELYDLIKN